MTDKLSEQNAGRWTFHLQPAQSLQFHIASEQDANDHIIIEGHDISSLLDYLYDNRELIYNLTHDQERRHVEAREELNNPTTASSKERQIERFFYVDDGTQRIRATF